MMPASASGVSRTRCSPKSFCRPSVIRKTPPSLPMSSPMSRTLSSRSMAARIPALSALAMVVRLAVLAGAAPPEEVSVVVISCSSSVLEAGLVGRELGGLALDQLVRVGIHVLEHLLVPGVGHRLAGVPESAGQL